MNPLAPRDQGTHEQQPRAGRSAALRVRALLPRCESDIAATPDRVAAGAGWVPPSREARHGAGLDDETHGESSRHPETSEGRARPTWVLAVHLGAMVPRSRVARAARASVRGSDSRGPRPTPPGEAEPRAARPQLEQRETHRQRPAQSDGRAAGRSGTGPVAVPASGRVVSRWLLTPERRFDPAAPHCTDRADIAAGGGARRVTRAAQHLAADDRRRAAMCAPAVEPLAEGTMTHDPELLRLLPLMRRAEFTTRAVLARRARAILRLPRAEARELVARAEREGLLEADDFGGLRICYREHEELLAP